VCCIKKYFSFLLNSCILSNLFVVLGNLLNNFIPIFALLFLRSVVLQNFADKLKKFKIALKQFLYTYSLYILEEYFNQSRIMYCIIKTAYYNGISFVVLSYGTLYEYSFIVHYDLISSHCINLMSYLCIVMLFIKLLFLFYCYDSFFTMHIVTLMTCFISDVHRAVHHSITSIVKPTRCTNVSNLFYFGMTLYTFQTVFPSIIRSWRLYIQQQAFIKQITADRLLASRQQYQTISDHLKHEECHSKIQ